MEINIVLGLLLLSGIQSERTSSDLHVRKKRIIDTSTVIDERELYQEVHYVVALLSNGRIHCTGTILTPHIILSAAHCIFDTRVIIVSGKIGTVTQRYHSVAHTVPHESFHPILMKNDLGLVVINEAIDLIHSYNRGITIFSGTIPPHSEGLISGWGRIDRESETHPAKVRSIKVPILSLQHCQRLLHNHMIITAQEICTLSHNRTKFCYVGDSGAPLVFGGRLVGVFSSYHVNNDPDFPDVFMSLLDPQYKLWVESQINRIYRFIHHRH